MQIATAKAEATPRTGLQLIETHTLTHRPLKSTLITSKHDKSLLGREQVDGSTVPLSTSRGHSKKLLLPEGT